MAKEFRLTNNELVTVRKSARAKRIILKIDYTGKAIVTVPRVVPYYAGLQFAKMQQQWIQSHAKQHTRPVIRPHSLVGKSHRVRFTPSETNIKSRVRQNIITVTHPKNMQFDDPLVQAEAEKATTRAIKKEADDYLPRLLHQLAKQNGYQYERVGVKNMRTRWGSCSSEKVINLSIWLMQLPEELIEYVCCHELTHLSHQHHQQAFWDELSVMIPDWKQCRKRLKQYRPSLMMSDTPEPLMN